MDKQPMEVPYEKDAPGELEARADDRPSYLPSGFCNLRENFNQAKGIYNG